MTIATRSSGARALLVATALTSIGLAGATVWAQNVEKSPVAVPANALSVGEIESRLTAQGIKVKEIEVRDLIAEVEGYDAQGREIEVIIDRRSGETLSHKFDR